jgi:tRNA uridine 5-carboxymethylaminomethyl modification enzyme
MFTSRAEHRLLLRQDNADLRLRPMAYELGLVSREQYDRVLAKQTTIAQETARLAKVHKSVEGKSVTLAQLIARPDWDYEKARGAYPELVTDFGADLNTQIELELKYAGYIERQHKEVAKLEHLDRVRIPANFNYTNLIGLRSEAKQKFSRFTPENLGAASRISGISPADISIVLVALQKRPHA